MSIGAPVRWWHRDRAVSNGVAVSYVDLNVRPQSGYGILVDWFTFSHSDVAARDITARLYHTFDADGMIVVSDLVRATGVAGSTPYTWPKVEDFAGLTGYVQGPSPLWLLPGEDQVRVTTLVAMANTKVLYVFMAGWRIPIDSRGVPEGDFGKLLVARAVR